MSTAGAAAMDVPSHMQTDQYRCYAALAVEQREGIDYRVSVRRRSDSDVAFIAPHGGSIERRTSAICTALAGAEHNRYLFEGLDEDGSFDALHITSHRFDEPRCLALIARCPVVVAVHGCSGEDRAVMLGGRDRALVDRFAQALAPIDVAVHVGNHRFPGTHRRNICNRGAAGRGVQLELTDALRGDPREAGVVAALR
ncbi:MAG: poly-gamma-glutamate hydrolase family protein, partial [Gammaproteobacteria bacterium]